jgi:hypothetical protein
MRQVAPIQTARLATGLVTSAVALAKQSRGCKFIRHHNDSLRLGMQQPTGSAMEDACSPEVRRLCLQHMNR